MGIYDTKDMGIRLNLEYTFEDKVLKSRIQMLNPFSVITLRIFGNWILFTQANGCSILLCLVAYTYG